MDANETASDPEALVSVQADLLEKITKTLANHKRAGDSRRTKSYFEARLLAIKGFRYQFEQRHRFIVQSELDINADYYKKDIADQFEEKYLEVYSEINEAFVKKFPPAPVIDPADLNASGLHSTALQPTPATSAPRFPSIPVPEFSGKYTDWPAFHDTFLRLVHNNQTVQAIEKFHLLKRALSATSDSDIRDLPLTNANYETAWKSVIERYHHSRVLFTHFMNQFSSQPNITRENAVEIKHLVETSRSCLNALRQLKIPIDTCDQIFVHFLIEKLPKLTHQLWEQKVGDSADIPVFKTLADFLTVRYRTLEALELRSVPNESQRTSTASQSKSNHNQYTKPSQHNKSSNRSETRVHHISKSNDSHTMSCILCSGPHILRKCQQFHQKDSLARKAVVDQTNLCSNCLSSTHQINSCTSARNCMICGQRHHTLLHQHTESPLYSASSSSNTNRSVSTIHNNHLQAAIPMLSNATKFHSSTNVLLPTAIIKVVMTDGSSYLLRTLVDQGSTGALISERACQALNLKRIPLRTMIKLPNNQQSSGKSIVALTYQSRFSNEATEFHIHASVVQSVTADLPTQTLTYHDWPHIRGLELADPDFHRSAPIDLLIGSDSYADIIREGLRKGQPNEPIAQQSVLGWLISGKAFEKSEPSAIEPVPVHCSHVSLEQLDNLVKQFYSIESIPAEQQYTPEEQWCRDFYARTTVRQPNGKYLVRLPLKTLFDPNQVIGKSHQIAANRFHQLERKLNRQSDAREQYHQAIQEYFDLNQITPITTTEETHLRFTENNRPSFTCCTLPHHAVIKSDSLTTKCRVVYDASAKTSNGKSLNDILCTGPRLQNDLPAILLNWRLPLYVITADITRMYRCIDMHDEDAEYHRILWYNPDGLLQEYKLTTVTFGTASAPYTAIETLHRIAHDESDRYPLAVNVLKNEMYVDDMYTGTDCQSHNRTHTRHS